METKCGAETEHPETLLPGDSFYKKSPNPDTIMDDKKYLLKGANYACLLRGPATVLQIQKHMLSANNWTKHRVPNGGVGGRTGDEGVCSPMGRMMMWPIRPPRAPRD